ncbi:hypothetical protein [Gordonia polyisoprenivorans]|uniref:hypothetical protein n=1 Tax=Gordonia polyisoprenivorans TaxID=84595 RepID=UPI001AD6866B|nr:hypothetical protein [Gordonia polyisoprenivorans]QTI67480.1 hypothetical protein J6U32_18000 [Gordonia polyisoprenivorans]
MSAKSEFPSEFSWDGLTPPGLEDAPPSEGGRYQSKAPKVNAETAEAIAAMSDELTQRRALRNRPSSS